VRSTEPICGDCLGCGTDAARCSGAGAGPPVPSLDAPRAGTGAVFIPTEPYPAGLVIGFDVGSTTVKAVVVDVAREEVLWQDYQRHETRQAEKAIELLETIERAFPDVPRTAMRLFVTGSGGAALAPRLGGRFVQEVNAVTLAVEKLHPDVMSIVELGGQDAKIIVFKEAAGGAKKKLPSMNDKCAGGTGAVIDKIAAKLGISSERVCEMGYDGLTLHPVAGKCGVFAETDINSLQKQGVPAEELMASLFESIVGQNLSVLTRGNTLRPTVLLLGGPNKYIRGLRECWRHHIPLVWKERGVPLPDPQVAAEDYVVTPKNAEYYAAFGAVEFGRTESQDDPNLGVYLGCDALRRHLARDLLGARADGAGRALWESADELARFREQYREKAWVPARFSPNERVEAFLGIDGGSTSTKGVLLGRDEQVIAKAYQLSKGNPIEDTKEIIAGLEDQVRAQGAQLEVLGAATTGYAKDILRDVLGADVALVETVAHTAACLHNYPGTEVIVDVGGQDIKLMILKDGRVKDFKLNTQCSAGNGYFLQATAQAFGLDVRGYADAAFSARAMPQFGYGCAVFLQSDIVDFQRQGWQPNEIMAGLAAVLPKNIWLYVAQIPNLATIGRKFVLQGGTQRNLAAVKAQADFIRGRFRGTGSEPEILVHEHCGESGAIGCALEAHRLWAERGQKTRFIGLERVRNIHYVVTQGEDTRCHFCKNECVRKFIDVNTGDGGAAGPRASDGSSRKLARGASLAPGYQRVVVATCEKGSAQDLADMRRVKATVDEVVERNPNLVDLAARAVFRDPRAASAADPLPRPFGLGPLERRASARRALMENRARLRIGFPRVLNLYAHAPFFIGYFTSLGVPYTRLVFSDYTSQELYRRGAKRGAVDPCYPSKLAIPHVHDLLYHHHKKKPLTHLFFPMVDSFPTFLQGVMASRSCPTTVATAEATHAAFIKEGDLFQQNGIVFKKTLLSLAEPQLCARQIYEDWKDELGLSPEESYRAVLQGLSAMERCYAELRRRSREVLDQLEREDRIGIVALARPYHSDPGVNHEVLVELQKRGYPIFLQDALPRDADILERLFGDEVRAGQIDSPVSIADVWKNSYSEHSSRKLWAAKYTARHPNLVALELSSFKCGHDAPIYTAVEEIIERSGTPYFCFKDIDENRPVGSIKIRIETIDYFLTRYRERLVADKARLADVERQVRAYEQALRATLAAGCEIATDGQRTSDVLSGNQPATVASSS
jgi:activator of 2-hydroxyglutaryl-CoA dehydratase/predicted nucleotide-binding protein (sugar kinase/HSP70/actin superfamily)